MYPLSMRESHSKYIECFRPWFSFQILFTKILSIGYLHDYSTLFARINKKESATGNHVKSYTFECCSEHFWKVVCGNSTHRRASWDRITVCNYRLLLPYKTRTVPKKIRSALMHKLHLDKNRTKKARMRIFSSRFTATYKNSFNRFKNTCIMCFIDS